MHLRNQPQQRELNSEASKP